MADVNAHRMMTCPYNMAHQVEAYRMQYHLEKCRKQYPNSKKVSCPFDATHILADAELDYHVSVCPQREMFDRARFAVDDCAEYRPSVEHPTVHVATEENWDDEVCTSYVPQPKEGHIIKKIKGATPAERRKARMEGVKNYRPPPPPQD
ncbi:hypothetical protein JYU34_008213 [Plutella xylostella]|uniref:Uncharacterized protein n=2 Tax=Plutella xylostella TaxID=51655 RepID=A0ABQ7QP20_PLUXY|nr:gametocyte-specific factor 1 [Plutella xylostella]XP_048480151.1 gametocyte-specific factor 1 [Plutella xylostella]KAG7306778.1 hypothetical protein JYU34_008213 [Plutella xylostella]CAG9120318.1 unnamed protein product [Plutella xylostella]